jgi:hypothetical protein
VFFRWQKEFFENGVAAFQAQERPHRQVEEKQKRIEYLESFSYPTRFCLWFLPVFSDEFRNRGFLDLVEYPSIASGGVRQNIVAAGGGSLISRIQQTDFQ